MHSWLERNIQVSHESACGCSADHTSSKVAWHVQCMAPVPPENWREIHEEMAPLPPVNRRESHERHQTELSTILITKVKFTLPFKYTQKKCISQGDSCCVQQSLLRYLFLLLPPPEY